jgi:hypothetical protein
LNLFKKQFLYILKIDRVGVTDVFDGVRVSRFPLASLSRVDAFLFAAENNMLIL